MSDAWETALHDEILRVERWLERHTNPDAPMRTRYRSPELLDEDVNSGFSGTSNVFFRASWQDFSASLRKRQQMVADVRQNRAAILAREGASLITPDTPSPQGRLLAFDPDNSLSDGAATAATDDFFDGDNIPPWDLWIAYNADADDTHPWRPFLRYLICWIPASLVEMVDFGIDVNPEECFQWLDNVLKGDE